MRLASKLGRACRLVVLVCHLWLLQRFSKLDHKLVILVCSDSDAFYEVARVDQEFGFRRLLTLEIADVFTR